MAFHRINKVYGYVIFFFFFCNAPTAFNRINKIYGHVICFFFVMLLPRIIKVLGMSFCFGLFFSEAGKFCELLFVFTLKGKNLFLCKKNLFFKSNPKLKGKPK